MPTLNDGPHMAMLACPEKCENVHCPGDSLCSDQGTKVMDILGCSTAKHPIHHVVKGNERYDDFVRGICLMLMSDSAFLTKWLLACIVSIGHDSDSDPEH